MLIRFVIFLISLLVVPFAVFASEPNVAVFDNLNANIDLSPYIETIEDVSHEYTLEDIQAGKYDHLWQRNTAAYFVGRNIQSKYWFRYTIRWEGMASEKVLLHINTHPSLLLRLGVMFPEQVFLGKEDKPAQFIRVGMLESFESRSFQGLQYAFPQTLVPGINQTVYGWARNNETATPVHFPFKLVSEADYLELAQIHNGVLIAFYTLMAALFFYNTCLFFTLRQPVYGVYLVFLSSAVLACSTLDGTASRYFWPADPEMLIRVTNVNGPLMAMSYMVSVVFALDGVKRWPRFYKVILTFISFGVLATIHNLLSSDYEVAMAITQVLGSLNIVLTLTIIVRAMAKRLPTAVYLFIAEVMMLIGTTCFMLVVQGLVPIHPLTSWGMHWGIAGEALLLSLALAARTRIAQQMAIDNQKLAIDHLQRYESLYNNSVEGLFQYDFKSKSLKTNDALARLFGFGSAEELPVGSDILSYFSTDVQKLLPSMLLEQGYIQNYEAEVDYYKTGKKIWVSMTMRLVKDAKGSVVGTEGSMVDISERKLKERAEQENAVARKNEEISEANNKAKTQFFASMSHEFRTPLTAILGYTEIAQGEGMREGERIAHIKTIANSAEHMLQLINDVLDLSKIEAQKLDVETISVDLFQLCQQVQDFISILASQKGFAFNIDYQLPLPKTLMSDPTRLKQALINLCSNAVKFTHEGYVTLHISCDSSVEVMSFAVEDTGIGLESGKKQELFKAFAQAEASTSRNFGGTGLGLHLSKLIANKLGGDITVESIFGRGSTFTLKVITGPLDNVSWVDQLEVVSEVSDSGIKRMGEVSQGEGGNESVSDDSGADLLKVLVAEDNEVNQKLLTFQVRQAGGNAIIASDGLEAIAHALLEPFGLILMDMDMPRMDGVTAVQFLRDNGIDTPVIALTGNVSPESVRECLDAGCDGHLAKPIDREKLVAVIEALRAAPEGGVSNIL